MRKTLILLMICAGCSQINSYRLKYEQPKMPYKLIINKPEYGSSTGKWFIRAYVYDTSGQWLIANVSEWFDDLWDSTDALNTIQINAKIEVLRAEKHNPKYNTKDTLR